MTNIDLPTPSFFFHGEILESHRRRGAGFKVIPSLDAFASKQALRSLGRDLPRVGQGKIGGGQASIDQFRGFL